MKLIVQGNALNIPIADKTIQCVITSPPYYGLRDYGVTGQIGLEQTPEEYVAALVAVFREVWRVLRDDGTLWLNLGDSYASNWGSCRPNKIGNPSRTERQIKMGAETKEKDLIGIPWMVAFALRADGWYLRSEIIWHKPNPMPESVRDRPTKAHEQIFLLSKQARYYYDQEAAKEDSLSPDSYKPRTPRSPDKREGDKLFQTKVGDHANGKTYPTRNRRSVWTVATTPYSEAHFATFPPKLIEPCVLAGTSAKGQCPKCGAPWVRIIEKTGNTKRDALDQRGESEYYNANGNALNYSGGHNLPERETKTIGWQPSCKCNAGEPVPQIVLDPFSGSGTTGKVSIEHGRRYVGVELNPQYIRLSKKRASGLQIGMNVD